MRVVRKLVIYCATYFAFSCESCVGFFSSAQSYCLTEALAEGDILFPRVDNITVTLAGMWHLFYYTEKNNNLIDRGLNPGSGVAGRSVIP